MTELNILKLFKYFAQEHAHYVSELHNHIDDHFKSKVDEINDKLTELHDEQEYDNQREIDDLEEEHYKISDYYVQTYRKALMVSLFIGLETYLNKICNSLKKNKNITIGFADLKGQGLERTKTYLTKVVGIDFTNINEIWSKLLIYYEIRNVVIHCDGVFPSDYGNIKKKKHVLDFVRDAKNNNLVVVNEKRKLFLMKDYVFELHLLIKSFVSKVVDLAG